jgi:hypothetical protein
MNHAEHNPLRGNVATTLGRPLQRPSPPDGWIKSSHSYANGNCVEVKSLPGGQIAVRDSAERSGPVLRFAVAGWRSFLTDVRAGAAARPAAERPR